MSGRPNGDASADYDVMSADPMGDDDDGHGWDANELGRGAGEDESEPLDDDQDGDDLDNSGDIDPDDEDPELEADEGDDEDPDGDEEEGEEGDEYEPIEPPANWPEDFRAAFAEIPPALQHFVMNTARNMQADYTRKTQAIAQEKQQIAQQRQMYSEFDRIIQPRAQQWALNGMNPAQAVSQLIALSDFATNDPTGFIKYFSNLRGVDLQQLVQGQGEEYVDPQVAALRGPVAQVQAQLNQMAQQMQQREHQQQVQQYQRAFSSTSAAIDSFSRQTGQDGKPLYPFFDDVVDDMTALIEAGRAQSMPDAYRQAVWLNESTRNRMLARSRADENARARRSAQQARQAASSLTGASGHNGAFTRGDLSIRDAINAAYDGSI
jgi:hypothetical protein